MEKFFLVAILLLLESCVSSTKYQNLQNTVDSLKIENQLLLQKNDELLNGEDRLFNLIKLYSGEGKYIEAKNTLTALKENHPESPLFTSNKQLFEEISKRAQKEQEIIDKHIRDSIRLANIDNIGDWEIGDYVNDFDEPTGEHFVQQTFIGEFSNSATSGSQLLILLRFYNYSYADGTKSLIYSFYFDEYLNGVEDEDFYDAERIKIVNKAQRKVYLQRYEYDSLKDESGNSVSLLDDILLSEGVYEFDMKFEYSTRYYFTINTEFLDNALIKAGLKELE